MNKGKDYLKTPICLHNYQGIHFEEIVDLWNSMSYNTLSDRVTYKIDKTIDDTTVFLVFFEDLTPIFTALHFGRFLEKELVKKNTKTSRDVVSSDNQ